MISAEYFSQRHEMRCFVLLCTPAMKYCADEGPKQRGQLIMVGTFNTVIKNKCFLFIN